MRTKKHFETKAIRTQSKLSHFGEHATPMYLTSSFVFDDAEDMRASFAEEKEKLLAETFNFKNKELPIIQMVDELKEEYDL